MGDNATKVFSFYNEVEVTPELQQLIHKAETIKFAVKTIRDVAVFTDKRILIADKQGLTGKKVEYYSIPYKSIVTYAIETAGRFDLDSEIKLTLAGGLKIELKFFKDKKLNNLLFKVYQTITEYMFG
ncbi:MAG: PH domain-containing protein [Firmicutes bacterium]|nr:PH domain-containing protein [Bacillota bacterium]